jgi:hypothetical protein
MAEENWSSRDENPKAFRGSWRWLQLISLPSPPAAILDMNSWLAQRWLSRSSGMSWNTGIIRREQRV